VFEAADLRRTREGELRNRDRSRCDSDQWRRIFFRERQQQRDEDGSDHVPRSNGCGDQLSLLEFLILRARGCSKPQISGGPERETHKSGIGVPAQYMNCILDTG
jgi:hypothetical protein